MTIRLFSVDNLQGCQLFLSRLSKPAIIDEKDPKVPDLTDSITRHSNRKLVSRNVALVVPLLKQT